MKKAILSISFICYFIVTCGVIVNFHYCMNRLSALQLFATEHKNCPTCGMKINKARGCCRDEVKVIKMEIDQKTVSNIHYELPALDAIVQIPSLFIAAPFTNLDETRHYKNHSPPLLDEQDTYLENRVFRI